MIKLTKPLDGLPLWLAPEQITAITFVRRNETAIWSADRESRVTESPEEVVRKIMEYKLLTAKHSAYYHGAAVVEDVQAEEDCLEIVSKVRINLAKLAGLEADSK